MQFFIKYHDVTQIKIEMFLLQITEDQTGEIFAVRKIIFVHIFVDEGTVLPIFLAEHFVAEHFVASLQRVGF